MIMGYNKVPKMEYYWCDNPFLKNECSYKQISKVISRYRLRFLFSKLYFEDPMKHANASHTYCVDELVNKGQEKRSKIICSECKVPLCAECFAPFHK